MTIYLIGAIFSFIFNLSMLRMMYRLSRAGEFSVIRAAIVLLVLTLFSWASLWLWVSITVSAMFEIKELQNPKKGR